MYFFMYIFCIFWCLSPFLNRGFPRLWSLSFKTRRNQGYDLQIDKKQKGDSGRWMWETFCISKKVVLMTNIMPMLCQCYANVMPKVCQCYVNVMPISCNANVMPILCQYYANIMPMLCLNLSAYVCSLKYVLVVTTNEALFHHPLQIF